MSTFTQLISHVTDVVAVFDKVVDAFNSQDKRNVLPGFFDINVALFTVNQQVGYVGRKPVLDYLHNKQFPIKPKFTPTTVQVTESQNGKVATILGTANWKDNDGDKDGPIRYSFNFVFHDNQWWVSTLWGSSDQ
jgi:hypothetical protein